VIPIPGFTSTSLISLGLTTIPFRCAFAAPTERKTINNAGTREEERKAFRLSTRCDMNARKSTPGFVFILNVAFYFAELR
jgi:hypothetical protein